MIEPTKTEILTSKTWAYTLDGIGGPFIDDKHGH